MFDAKKCSCGCENTSEFVPAPEITKYISSSRIPWLPEDTRNLAHARAVNARAAKIKVLSAA